MFTVQQHQPIASGVLALSTFRSPDYADHFSVASETIHGGSIQAWARAVIDRSAGAAGQFIWRGLLRLKLQDAPDHIGGWTVAGTGPDWIRLASQGWLMQAEIVIVVREGELSMVTLIRYASLACAAYWPPLSAIHRRAMPGLLIRATRHFAAMTRPADSAPSSAG